MNKNTSNSLELHANANANACAPRGFVAFLVELAKKIMGIGSEAAINRRDATPSAIAGEGVPRDTESVDVLPQPDTKKLPVKREKPSANASRDNEKREAAIRILGKSAKKDPSMFFAIADLYSTENAEDRKLAAKYKELGRKREKSLHQSHIRDLRRYAEIRRGGRSCKAHFSTSRRIAMRLADIDLFCHEVIKYKRRKSRAA